MPIPSFTPPPNYYDRFDPAKRYEQHLFLAGGTPQSAEINEIQRRAAYHTTSVADAIFADGDIQSGCGISIYSLAGAVDGAAGNLYVLGAIRPVPASRIANIDFAGSKKWRGKFEQPHKWKLWVY